MQLPDLSSLCTIRMNSNNHQLPGNAEQVWNSLGDDGHNEMTPGAAARAERAYKRNRPERLRKRMDEMNDDASKRAALAKKEEEARQAMGSASASMTDNAKALDGLLNEDDDEPVFRLLPAAAAPAAAAPAAAAEEEDKRLPLWRAQEVVYYLK